MKKVLFATTALVMTAGVASAEVTISGFAEMGIFGGNNGVEDQFFTDIDATFTMSGTTDNGLTFGASIDLDESDGAGTRGNSLAFSGATQGGESIFVSGTFGTITMGDTDGAFDWALQETNLGGSINDAHTTHAGFDGNSGLDGFYDGQIFRYEYVLGDLAFAGTLEIDDTGVGDEVIGVGVRYGTDLGGVNVRFGAGYQTVDDNAAVNVDIWGVSVDARFAQGFRVIGNYTDLDGFGGRDDHWSVAAAYSVGAITVAANYGSFGNVVGGDDNGFGVSATYDLGGGAELQAGYSVDDDAANFEDDRYDFGLALSF